MPDPPPYRPQASPGEPGASPAIAADAVPPRPQLEQAAAASLPVRPTFQADDGAIFHGVHRGRAPALASIHTPPSPPFRWPETIATDNANEQAPELPGGAPGGPALDQ